MLKNLAVPPLPACATFYSSPKFYTVAVTYKFLSDCPILIPSGVINKNYHNMNTKKKY